MLAEIQVWALRVYDYTIHILDVQNTFCYGKRYNLPTIHGTGWRSSTWGTLLSQCLYISFTV